MKEEWKKVQLKDLCELRYGKALASGERSADGKYLVFGANGPIDKTHKAHYNKPSIIIGRKGTAGALQISYAPFYPLDVTYYTVFDDQKIDIQFLYYLLLSKDLTSLSKGVKPGINRDDVYSLSVSYPTLVEQKRIVAILDDAFVKIDKIKHNAERNIENLALLCNRLTNNIFEAIEGEISPQKMGEVCHFIRGPFGGSLKKNCFKLSGYAVYEQQHAIYGKLNFRYFIDSDKYIEMNRFAVLPGEIIMSCSGTLGKMYIIPQDAPKGIINQALLKLTPKDNLNNQYLMYWMQSQRFQNALQLHSKGAAIQNVASVKILKGIPIHVPSIDNQKSIVIKIMAIEDKNVQLKINYQRTIDYCNTIKNIILAKAFNGEL